jgi:uncharacterized membrane protein SpoIIM required for sporulation
MIIDLQRFVEGERPYWTELGVLLGRLEGSGRGRMPLNEVRRFHYLYERTAAGLAKLTTFSSEPETRRFLEGLVARAYGEINETRERQHRFSPWNWFFQTLPQAFRRRVRAFWVSIGVTLAGVLFGGLAVAFDPAAKEAIMPDMFAGHRGDPSERVAREEQEHQGPSATRMTSFSAQLMVNNISVSIRALAFGITYGIGTILLLFFNGIILGVVCVDYVLAGQTTFLLGWLLPHGVIELPAIFIAAQAGLVLAGALIGWGRRDTLRARLREVMPDLVTLICGVALMLVWAGVVEAFFSQFHQPVLPYSVKISFGCVELMLLILFLSRGGRRIAPSDPASAAAGEQGFKSSTSRVG